MSWVNDGTHYCENCDIKFRVYTEENEPTVNFCPTCASRNLEFVEEDE